MHSMKIINSLNLRLIPIFVSVPHAIVFTLVLFPNNLRGIVKKKKIVVHIAITLMAAVWKMNIVYLLYQLKKYSSLKRFLYIQKL